MISILYADLVGFTALSHDIDPEEVREVQRGFQHRVRVEVEHGGGRVEKYIGDAVVASFADPADAVRVACRTISAVPEGLASRAGVCTGGEEVRGELFEIADRLQHLAGPNAVGVDEPTVRATEADFDYEQLDTIVLPGRPRPAPVFRTMPSDSTEASAAGEDDGPATERRQFVSVLFADLFNLAAPSHSADPRDIRSTQHPYYAGLQREIERFGGTVEKFIGDALMAVFGAPVSREDDAERAVRAAVRIPEVVQELNEQDDFLELGVRVAVNSGEVVVAVGAHPEEGEGMVTGDVVNTAARLLGVAPFNGVAVGRPTYEATKSAFAYEQLAAVSVKGIAEPVPVYSPA